jgi:hypothetical protein
VSELFPKTAVQLGTINVQNSALKFSLASPIEKSQLALLLVAFQIPMLLVTAVIIAGSPGMNVLLNGQMAPLNLNGMAQGMCSAVGCC